MARSQGSVSPRAGLGRHVFCTGSLGAASRGCRNQGKGPLKGRGTAWATWQHGEGVARCGQGRPGTGLRQCLPSPPPPGPVPGAPLVAPRRELKRRNLGLTEGVKYFRVYPPFILGAHGCSTSNRIRGWWVVVLVVRTDKRSLSLVRATCRPVRWRERAGTGSSLALGDNLLPRKRN